VGQVEATNLTVLIAASRGGDASARDRLFSLVYDELRAIARRTRFVGREGETLQPTALANEAFILLSARFPVPPRDQPESRATFFRAMAQAMRTILRDHWRKRHALKRGVRGSGEEALDVAAAPQIGLGRADFLALDAAIDRLERYNSRWFDVVMHRHFAGRGVEETAELMGTGPTTVKSDWKLACAWLERELTRE
jgi:RNA polymerase sigma factor (TIGR02999 family)